MPFIFVAPVGRYPPVLPYPWHRLMLSVEFDEKTIAAEPLLRTSLGDFAIRGKLGFD
jgi:hypothetical protein